MRSAGAQALILRICSQLITVVSSDKDRGTVPHCHPQKPEEFPRFLKILIHVKPGPWFCTEKNFRMSQDEAELVFC